MLAPIAADSSNIVSRIMYFIQICNVISLSVKDMHLISIILNGTELRVVFIDLQ